MKKISGIFFFGCIVLFFCFPKHISQGAKEGLLLWFYTVVPSLLPFFILSNFTIKRGLVQELTAVLQPFLRRVLHISGSGCFAMVIGGIAGYPAGANAIAQLYKKEQISREEAQYLLGFCNNASPVFLMSYIGSGCLHMKYPVLLYLIVVLSGFFSSGCFLGRLFPDKKRAYQAESTVASKNRQPLMAVIEESILDSFTALTKIGGYIILFSVLAFGLNQINHILPEVKGVGMAVMEITTGSRYLSETNASPVFVNCIIAAACAFGGLSSVAQTAGVLSETDLSIKKYVFGKLRQGIIAGVFTLFLSSVFFGIIS